jgi:tetratricopeptide (TPR) repeat protein
MHQSQSGATPDQTRAGNATPGAFPASDPMGHLAGGGMRGVSPIRAAGAPAAHGIEDVVRRASEERARQARDACARGDVHFLQGEFPAALERFREAVRLHPTVADYHHRLACAERSADQPMEVEGHLLEAVRLNPRFGGAHEGLAAWYLQQGEIVRALEHSAKAVALWPREPGIQITRACVLAGNAQTREAMEILEALMAAGSTDPRLAATFAHIAPMIGQEARAAAMLERAMESKSVSPHVRTQFHFSAANLYEATGCHEQAFAHARKANAGVKRHYDPAAHAAWTQRQIGAYNKRNLAALPRATHGSRRPVFIVGMPRSGTSLVEQILATHPDVFGGGELKLLNLTANALAHAPWARDTAGTHRLDTLSVNRANGVAAVYVKGIEALNSTARYVTDKMPLNFETLGIAEMLLPDCHIIHCVRDPRDTCLSCYFTSFAEGNEFSFDLAHLATYYRDYRTLMDHWKQVLTVPMIEVRYEDVVADKEAQTRRLLEFLDLPWDERCLAFHENKRYVATSSRDQVRRPIYSSSVGRWKHYEKYIPELMKLGDGL